MPLVSNNAPLHSNKLFDVGNLKDDGSNFPMWKFRLQMILELRELWAIVNHTESQPEAANDGGLKAWTLRDRAALLQITLTLDDAPLSSVMLARTSADAWDKLVGWFEGKGKQTIASLIGELFRGTLSDEELLEAQLDAMQLKAHILERLGQPLDDSLVAIAMVTSLPPSYNTLRTILISPHATLTTDTVISQVLNEEKSRRERSNTQSAFFAKTSDKKGASSKSTKGKSSPRPGNGKKCAHCKKNGHVKDECRKLKAEQAAAATGKDTREKGAGDLAAKTVVVRDGDETIRLYVADALSSQRDTQTRWIVDSGASAPMCSQREWFVTYAPLEAPKRVWLGDERFILATGIGSVALRLKREDGHETAVFPDVYHVPDLNGNLLFVSYFARKGYSVSFKQDGCSILDGSGKKLASAFEREGLYILHPSLTCLRHARTSRRLPA